jgi:hypothetical protein
MNPGFHESKRRRPHAQAASRKSRTMPEHSGRVAQVADAIAQDGWVKMVQTFIKLELG